MKHMTNSQTPIIKGKLVRLNSTWHVKWYDTISATCGPDYMVTPLEDEDNTNIENYLKGYTDDINLHPAYYEGKEVEFTPIISLTLNKTFARLVQPKKDIYLSDEDKVIVDKAIEFSQQFTNKFVPRISFIEGAKWYKENFIDKK